MIRSRHVEASASSIIDRPTALQRRSRSETRLAGPAATRSSKRLLSLLLVPTVMAQQAPPDAIKAGRAALGRGEYLRAVSIYKAAAVKSDGTIADDETFQAWEQTLPMITGELPVGGLRKVAQEAPRPDMSMLAKLRLAVPHDAIAEIVARARATSIVILNEAHTSPRDRAFGLSVARALRPLGYRVLAAEAFVNEVDGEPKSSIQQLVRDRFVRRSTGYYTRDPVFAGFVREAIAMGYEPVAYEMRFDQYRREASESQAIAVREQAQAQNLFAKVFSSHPEAKALIYVGHGHVSEKMPDQSDHGVLAMAGRLKRLTGIDPLTIDQTTLTDTTPAVSAAYTVASAHITRPSILFRGSSPLVVGRFTGAVDLQIVHPARSYRYGRPAWLETLAGCPLAIPSALLPLHGQRLVQAFAADAPIDAVPLDQVLIDVSKPVPMFMVPPVKVRFAAQDPS